MDAKIKRPYFMVITEGGISRIENMESGTGIPEYDIIDYDVDGSDDVCDCRIKDVNSDHYHN